MKALLLPAAAVLACAFAPGALACDIGRIQGDPARIAADVILLGRVETLTEAFDARGEAQASAEVAVERIASGELAQKTWRLDYPLRGPFDRCDYHGPALRLGQSVAIYLQRASGALTPIDWYPAEQAMAADPRLAGIAVPPPRAGTLYESADPSRRLLRRPRVAGDSIVTCDIGPFPDRPADLPAEAIAIGRVEKVTETLDDRGLGHGSAEVAVGQAAGELAQKTWRLDFPIPTDADNCVFGTGPQLHLGQSAALYFMRVSGTLKVVDWFIAELAAPLDPRLAPLLEKRPKP